MPDLLQLAEQVVIARQNLAAAEAAFRAATTKAPTGKVAGPSVVSGPNDGAPISQRTRDLLKDARKPLAFREIINLLGGGDIEMAVRSALKQARAKNNVTFKGGLYSWKGDK